MRVLRTLVEARAWRRAAGATVGFVPTMGYLHEGHLELVRRARAENDAVIVSIFVNPTQFGPKDDFSRYPRDEARDLALLEVEGVAAVFMPTVEEMYPEGFATAVDVSGGLTSVLEGAARPGHFRGMATVVAKLLSIAGAERAYFGRKDAQQLAVVRRMASDLNLAVEIVPCDTVREPDGLAMSSRNTYLTSEERRAAPALYAGLRQALALFEGGERDPAVLREAVRARVVVEPAFALEYVSVADPETLAELDWVKGAALVSVAARLGRTRLIDNVTLGERG
ncbi:MAG: pantoate--beta-alanine ligase [Dehalococcoidia bacterium]|nr:pantoate--beta-alanine ligase [Dehalococcoidia bacterium]